MACFDCTSINSFPFWFEKLSLFHIALGRGERLQWQNSFDTWAVCWEEEFYIVLPCNHKILQTKNSQDPQNTLVRLAWNSQLVWERKDIQWYLNMTAAHLCLDYKDNFQPNGPFCSVKRGSQPLGLAAWLAGGGEGELDLTSGGWCMCVCKQVALALVVGQHACTQLDLHEQWTVHTCANACWPTTHVSWVRAHMGPVSE